MSVIVPTYHRPDGLRRAVGSVLAQELPPGVDLEVVIGVSDPDASDDLAAANALAEDPRVRVARAKRPGPAAARNAAIAQTHGDVIAMIDDDCEARPSWLAHGLAAIHDADLVQGRTVPAAAAGRFDHTLSVEPPSWLWESCNLLVRRAAIDEHGLFDEDWNPTGRVGGHMGEDVEWGWRLVRMGARPGYAREAIVEHDVRPQAFSNYLGYQAQLRYFPRLFQVAPEARRVFFHGYFVNRRHAVIAAALAAAAAAAALEAGQRHLPAASLGALSVLLYLSPLRRQLRRGAVLDAFRELGWRVPSEAVEVGAALYGSLRWRRLLI